MKNAKTMHLSPKRVKYVYPNESYRSTLCVLILDTKNDLFHMERYVQTIL